MKILLSLPKRIWRTLTVPRALTARGKAALHWMDLDRRERSALEAAGNDPGKRNDVRAWYRLEAMLRWEEEQVYRTRALLRRADRMEVPHPPANSALGGEFWGYSGAMDERYLTRDGIDWLKPRIRDEQRWRLDRLAIAMTLLTGVIGATTGLLAILARVMGWW